MTGAEEYPIPRVSGSARTKLEEYLETVGMTARPVVTRLNPHEISY